MWDALLSLIKNAFGIKVADTDQLRPSETTTTAQPKSRSSQMTAADLSKLAVMHRKKEAEADAYRSNQIRLTKERRSLQFNALRDKMSVRIEEVNKNLERISPDMVFVWTDNSEHSFKIKGKLRSVQFDFDLAQSEKVYCYRYGTGYGYGHSYQTLDANDEEWNIENITEEYVRYLCGYDPPAEDRSHIVIH